MDGSFARAMVGATDIVSAKAIPVEISFFMSAPPNGPLSLRPISSINRVEVVYRGVWYVVGGHKR